MSTNSKNTIRKAYLSNFTTKKKHRYILTEKNSELDSFIQKNLISINESINTHIQELSVRIQERQIPYIIIEKIPITFDTLLMNVISQDEKIKRVRGMIRDIKTEGELVKKIATEYTKDETNISHAIEFFAHTAYNELTFSNNNFDAKILLDDEGLKMIFTDIFMDCAMFNSYSFLKGMKEVDKQEFGVKKLEFYIKKGLSCFYRLDRDDEEKILYYSLAFSCRESMNEFNFEKYIELWDEFVKEYFPDKQHKERSVAEQLKQHVDYKQLPKELKQKIMSRDAGAYLVLRINHDRTEKLHSRIDSYFGKGGYYIGKVKLVKISEYYMIDDMLKNLDVSAYKVIRPKKRNRGNN